jgi:hypothetical protein
MSHQQAELAPAVSLVDAVKVNRSGDTVDIRADVTQDMLANKPGQSRSPDRQTPTQRPRPRRSPPRP